jgi:hypothetical protein
VVSGCNVEKERKELAIHYRKHHLRHGFTAAEEKALKTADLRLCHGCNAVLSTHTHGHGCTDKRTKTGPRSASALAARRAGSGDAARRADGSGTAQAAATQRMALQSPALAAATVPTGSVGPAPVSLAQRSDSTATVVLLDREADAANAAPNAPAPAAAAAVVVSAASLAQAVALANAAAEPARDSAPAAPHAVAAPAAPRAVAAPAVPRAVAAPAAAARVPSVLDGAETLRSRPFTYRRLPRELWPLWRRYVGAVITQYREAKRNADMPLAAAALHRLLSAVTTLLKREGGVQAIRQRYADLLRVAEEDGAAVAAAAEAAAIGEAKAAAHRAGGVYFVPPVLEQRVNPKVKRAVAHLASGAPNSVRRGAAALMDESVVASNAETYRALEALHPKTDAKVPLPPCPATDGDSVVIEAKALARVCSGYRGNAAGPSGWTADLLSIVLDDDNIASGMALVVTDIANGDIHDDALRTRLQACALIGLPKGGDHTRLRPVAMGELFVKLAAACLISSSTAEIAQVFKDHQFGIGRSGGSEAAALVVNNALWHSDSTALLALDQGNAYNSIPRQFVMQKLYDRPALRRFWRLADFLYGRPSPLLMYGAGGQLVSDRVYCSEQGVRQGCALGALLYANAVQQIYIDVAAAAGPELIVCVAVMDDVVLVGSVAALRRAFEAFKALALRYGISLNVAKSGVLWPLASEVPLEVRLFVQSNEFRPTAVGAMAWVGSVVGKDAAAMRDIVTTDVTTQHDPLFKALRSDGLGAQNATLLLRASALPRAVYVARTVHPDVADPALGRFDVEVQNTLAHIVHRAVARDGHVFGPAGDSYRLPLAGGGLGLRALRVTSAAAYAAAVAVAVQYMSAAERAILISRGMVHDGLEAAIRRLRIGGAHKMLVTPQPPKQVVAGMTAAQREQLKPRECESLQQFVQHYTRVSAIGLQLQRVLTSRLDAAARTRIAGDARTAARLDSAGDRNAYRWLVTPPTEAQHKLADVEVVRALRHRIGIAPEDGHVMCACGAAVTDANFDHFQGCTAVRRDALDARHGVVQFALAKIATEAGVATVMDYASHSARRASGSRLRPDGRFAGLFASQRADVMTDVSVTNPSSASLASRVNGKRLTATAIREQAKTQKYAAFAEQQRVAFCPFVVESYGALGKCALEIVNALARRANASVVPSALGFSVWSYKTWALAAMSAAVQRGNSKLVDVALARSRWVRRGA